MAHTQTWHTQARAVEHTPTNTQAPTQTLVKCLSTPLPLDFISFDTRARAHTHTTATATATATATQAKGGRERERKNGCAVYGEGGRVYGVE